MYSVVKFYFGAYGTDPRPFSLVLVHLNAHNLMASRTSRRPKFRWAVLDNFFDIGVTRGDSSIEKTSVPQLWIGLYPSPKSLVQPVRRILRSVFFFLDFFPQVSCAIKHKPKVFPGLFLI